MAQFHTEVHKCTRNIFLFCCVSFILCACWSGTSNHTNSSMPTGTVTIIDSGFLSGIPCSAPCFFGSTPGITDKNEVITHLEDYNIYSFCTEKAFTDSTRSVMNCTSEFSLWFDGSNFTEITIEPKFTAITLEQVISKYGPPTSVDIILGGTNDVQLIIGIIYENPQFVLHLTDPTSQKSVDNNIQPESKILWIDYLSETKLKSFTFDKCTVPWEGYGIYELIPGC